MKPSVAKKVRVSRRRGRRGKNREGPLRREEGGRGGGGGGRFRGGGGGSLEGGGGGRV